MTSSYIYYLHEIQELKRNRLYSFAYLIKVSPPDKVWGVNRSTLVRERDNGRLICHRRTAVLGSYFIDWATTPAIERDKFIKMKVHGRYWPQTNRGTTTEGEKT